MGRDPIMRFLLFIFFFAYPAFCQDVPYYPRSVDKTQDISAISQNFRDLAGRVDLLSDSDLPKEHEKCLLNPMFCVNSYTRRINISDASIYLSTVSGTSLGICFVDGTCQNSAGVGSFAITPNGSQFTGDGTVANPLTLQPSSVTLQGNTFNGASNLLRADDAGKLLVGNLPADGYSGTYLPVGVAVSQSIINLSTVTTAFEGKLSTTTGTMSGNLTVGGTVQADVVIASNVIYTTATGSFPLTAASANSAYVSTTTLAILTGTGSTGAGVGAGTNNIGNNNTFIGYQAGYQNYDLGRNTFIGSEAGYTNSGENNTFLGYQAGYTNTTGANNILIGKQISAPTGTTNNFISIGNLILGDLIQSSVTIPGSLYANAYYGDGSNLTGIAAGGDSLGSHIATQTVNMAGYSIVNIDSATVSGSQFSVGGSTLVVANGRVSIGNTNAIGKYLWYSTTTATGGTISSYTNAGNTWWVHQFKSTGSFTFTPGISVTTGNVLVVAGGGSGGGGNYLGGGGGAGGYISSANYSLSGESFNVVVGTGGAGVKTSVGINGGPSTFDTLTATGGGGGGWYYITGPVQYPGNSGGSGGGGCGAWSVGGSSMAGQGYYGGNGSASANYGAGGGGGAGGAGVNGVGSVGGNGGLGVASSITGSELYYAGGGGGAVYNAGTGGVGGSGVGGNGSTGAGTNGVVNTGSGGGGAERAGTATSGSGGTGIVIVSYISNGLLSELTTSATLDVSGDIVASTFTGNVTGNVTGTLTGLVPDSTFSVGGSTFVVTGGNVGIGTASPVFAGYDSKLYISGSGSGTGGRTAFIVKNTQANSAANFFLINSDNNYLGAQVSGPSYSVGAVAVFNTTALNLSFGTDGYLVPTGGTHKIFFQPGGYASVKTMTLTPGSPGKVGIGTETPAQKLHVSSGVIYNDGAGAGMYTTGNSTAAYFFGDGSNLTGVTGSGISTVTVDAMPVGSIIAYSTTTPPEAYLYCDGSAYSTTTYSVLFEAVGYRYGGADNEFNVPDLRGMFMRGLDDGREYDPDTNRVVGSTQTDTFQGHWHDVTRVDGTAIKDGNYSASGTGVGLVEMGAATIKARAAITDGTNGTPRTALETRPENIAVAYMIKYQNPVVANNITESSSTFTGQNTFALPVIVSTSISTAVTPVAGGVYTDNIVKAWVMFSGADGTILDSFNVASVTRVTTGVYTIYWDRDFSSANFAATCMPYFASGLNNSGYAANMGQLAGSLSIQTEYTGNVLYDAAFVSCMAMGRQ